MTEKKSPKSKATTKKMLANNLVKVLGIAVAILILLAIVLFVGLEVTANKYTDKTKPSQSIYSQNLSGLNKEELIKEIDSAIKSKLDEPFKLNYQDTSYLLTYNDLGIIEDSEIFATQVEFYKGKPNHAELLKDFFSKNTLKPSPQLSEAAILGYVQSKIPSLKPANNAHFTLDDLGEVVLVPAVDGVKINEKSLLQGIKSNLVNNENTSVLIETEAKEAEVVASDIEGLEEQFLQLVTKDLTFSHGEVEEIYSLSENPDLIQFALLPVETEETAEFDEEELDTNEEKEEPIELELKVVADSEILTQFAVDKLKPQIDQEPKKIEVLYDAETEEVTFSDDGMPALVVDLEGLQAEVDLTLDYSFHNNNKLVANVPVIEIDPAVEIAPELQARGIKEIITSTYTTYYGSTYARMTNINVGSAKFNGMIIAQGEEFSFNDKLGRVDGTTGFVPELVIKSDGTKPEYGGGLCQVSSTFYRAALDSGIEITERYPHSYAVSYYAQVMGHGLDATIYPGVKDVKIVNNTPGDILLQTFTDGPKLYYRIYGTKTKEVAYDGPYLSNYTSPGKAQEILKPELEPGYRKQVEVPHTGFNAVWYVTTTDIETGEITEETINTRYQAIPAKFIVGPDAADTEGSSDPASSSETEAPSSDSQPEPAGI